MKITISTPVNITVAVEDLMLIFKEWCRPDLNQVTSRIHMFMRIQLNSEAVCIKTEILLYGNQPNLILLKLLEGFQWEINILQEVMEPPLIVLI